MVFGEKVSLFTRPFALHEGLIKNIQDWLTSQIGQPIFVATELILLVYLPFESKTTVWERWRVECYYPKVSKRSSLIHISIADQRRISERHPSQPVVWDPNGEEI